MRMFEGEDRGDGETTFIVESNGRENALSLSLPVCHLRNCYSHRSETAEDKAMSDFEFALMFQMKQMVKKGKWDKSCGNLKGEGVTKATETGATRPPRCENRGEWAAVWGGGKGVGCQFCAVLEASTEDGEGGG